MVSELVAECFNPGIFNPGIFNPNPPTYLHLIFAILHFEISSLMN